MNGAGALDTRSVTGWREALRQQDLRLVPAAAAVWLATFLGLRVGWQFAVVCGLLTCCCGAGLGWLTLAGRGLAGHRVIRVVACTLMTCGVVVAAWTGPRLLGAASNPLRQVAQRGGSAELRVAITADAMPVKAAGFGNSRGGARSELVPAKVLGWHRGDRWFAADGEILLITPVAGWSELLRGQRLIANGPLDTPFPGETAVAVMRARGSPSRLTQPPWLQRTTESFRAGLRQASQRLPDDPGGLWPALLIGDRSGLASPVEDDFQVSGMTYLTAVGGWHFMVVCGAVLLLLRLLRAPPQLSAMLAGLVLGGYLEIVGARPSVLRAAVMVAAGLLALGLGRARSTSGALSIAVIGLVIAKPGFGADLGFALSVVATTALLVATPPVARALRRRRVPAGVAELIAVATVAHLATAPLIAAQFGQFSVVAVAANVAAEPAFVPAMVLGALATACAPLCPAVADGLAHLAYPFLSWLIIVAHFFAGMPAASIGWPLGLWGALLMVAAIVAGALLLRRRRLRLMALTLVVVLLLFLVPPRIVRPGWPPAGWAMVDCDVGQGDGEVLATAHPGTAVVVDTGPDPRAIAECLDRLGISRVPLVVLSHLHADHIGGLAAVLAQQQVGAVAVGASRVPAWAWRQVREETAAAGVPLLQVRIGERLRWPGLTLAVLGPEPEDALAEGDGSSGDEINNTSVVLKATTAAGRILLTGDVEIRAQQDLLADGVDVSADILKVPHHGSPWLHLIRYYACQVPHVKPASTCASVTTRRGKRKGSLTSGATASACATATAGAMWCTPTTTCPPHAATGDPNTTSS